MSSRAEAHLPGWAFSLQGHLGAIEGTQSCGPQKAKGSGPREGSRVTEPGREVEAQSSLGRSSVRGAKAPG